MDELVIAIHWAMLSDVEGMRNPSVPVTSRGPKVLLDVAAFHQGGPRAVKAEGSEGSQGGISFCERHLAAHPAGNWRTWESCHQTSLFLWLARCLAGWHLALLRGEKPPSVLLGGGERRCGTEAKKCIESQ